MTKGHVSHLTLGPPSSDTYIPERVPSIPVSFVHSSTHPGIRREGDGGGH